MFGLLDRDIKYILQILSKYSEINEAIIFGSRALGNYKKGSDIDLVVKGELLNNRILYAIMDDLNENYPLPYYFDVLIYQDINSDMLIDHIKEFGKIIYQKK